MRREDSNDSDIERVLRGHFRAEASGLRISRDPWTWLERRLDPDYVPTSRGKWPGLRLGRFRLTPRALGALALTGCVVAFVVGVFLVNLDPTYRGADFASVSGPSGPSGPAGGPAPLGPMSAVDSAAAVESALAASQMSEEAMSEVMVDQIAEQEMATEAEPTPSTADSFAVLTSDQSAESTTRDTESQPEASTSSVQPADTTFQDTQRQPAVSAWEDNVSTFSLDTDRTSYHLALNWARAGYDIEPDSVRAEEWINAFDYLYEPPLRDDSFAITTDVIVHPLDGGKHLARIAFQAPVLPDDTPVNVTLVLDASGSMADGGRVSIAREAAESIRLSLRERDRIAVVHFTTSVIHDLTVEPQPTGLPRCETVYRSACPSQLHERAGRPRSWRAASRPGAPGTAGRVQLHHPDVGRCCQRGRDRSVCHPGVGRRQLPAEPIAAYHDRGRHRELQRLSARAACAARERLVPVPEHRGAGASDFHSRQLACAVGAIPRTRHGRRLRGTRTR